MIVILKPNVSEARRDQLISWFKAQNLGVHISQGDYQTVLGLIGDTKSVDMDLIASLDIVDAVRRVSDPFKCCNRKFHPDDTIVDVSGVKIGGGNFAMIAGPCSVESEEQIVGVANDVKKAGAKLLRGGAFKPRTSPYDFQGLKAEGLRLLSVAKKETGLPIVTEIMDVRHLDLFDASVMPTSSSISVAFCLAASPFIPWCSVSASQICAPTVLSGFRLVIGSCMTIAISFPRTLSHSFSVLKAARSFSP